MSNIEAVQWPGWETVRLIGRGSFGAVYEIQRDVFGDVEKAALKVISIPQNAGDIEEMYSDGYDDESITSTFQSHLKSIVAEYSLMRKMNGSANIVNCDDVRYVQHDDGIGWDIFIKMELLTPLTKALPNDVPEETVVQIAKDMCAALELCKKHEIVHRDIKPQNIFVSPNGDYKLGDFGIAKTVEKTMGGTKIGTYKYMAPEVYNNQPYGSAADIYSLGLVLYWLLNERRMPFLPLPPAKLRAGMDEDARYRRLSGEPLPAPAHGSRELKQLVLKACAYDPKDRFASAAEMLEAVNNLNGGAAVSVDSADVNQSDDLTVGPIFNGRQKQDDSKTDMLNGNATVGPIFSKGNGPKPTAIPTAGIPVPVSNRGAVASNASRNSTPMHYVQVHTAGTNTDRTVYTQQPKYHNNQIAGQDLGQRPIPSYPYEQQVWQAQTQNSQKYTRSNREKTKRIYIFSGCAAAVLALVLLIAGVSGAFKSTDKPVPQNNTQAPSANTSERPNVHVHENTIIEETESVIPPQTIQKSHTISMIQAGIEHTVILKEDGTVACAGNNSDGRCNTEHWSNVVEISATYKHTVGLKSNGTVLAVGSNEFGQCDVHGWTEVISIAAGGYHTVGLRADGTVVSTGRNNYGQCEVSSWTGIVAVYAGLNNTVGLKSDGTVVAIGYNQYDQCKVQGWRDIVDISVSDSHILGLRQDGTVYAAGKNNHGQCNVSGIENVVEIWAGCSYSTFLQEDGSVITIGIDDVGQAISNDWTQVEMLCSGFEHIVGIREDGTIIWTGVNNYGQCNVEEMASS